MAPIEFKDQVGIVTGSGRTLGRAYALELARRGASVVVNDIRRDDADEVVKEITEAGGKAIATYDSIGTSEGGKAVVEAALESFGGVHAIVHNAGMTWSGNLDEMSDDDLGSMLDVHLLGAFHVLRPAWPVMREQEYGRVALTSSSGGFFARDNGSSYAAAKGGLFGLSRSLAHEGAPHGIVVNCFLPLAQTAIFQGAPLQGGPLTMRIAEQLKQLYEIGLPPEDVVPLVAFLSSSACVSGGHIYWAYGGGYAEVFTGLTDGWWAPRDERPATLEDIVEHLPEIENRDKFTVPGSIVEEFDGLIERLTS